MNSFRLPRQAATLGIDAESATKGARRVPVRRRAKKDETRWFVRGPETGFSDEYRGTDRFHSVRRTDLRSGNSVICEMSSRLLPGVP